MHPHWHNNISAPICRRERDIACWSEEYIPKSRSNIIILYLQRSAPRHTKCLADIICCQLPPSNASPYPPDKSPHCSALHSQKSTSQPGDSDPSQDTCLSAGEVDLGWRWVGLTFLFLCYCIERKLRFRRSEVRERRIDRR